MISAIVLTKNEQKSLEVCLKTLKWCDEVIVIDDYSEDKTAQMAEKLGAKVMKHHLDEDFSAQRNFGLRQAKNTWVLFIDADEKVSPQLRAEIQRAIKGEINGFYLKRTDFLFGRELKHGETSKVRLLRLARKNAGEWRRRVDETWEIKGQTTTLDNPLLHSPHPTMNDFLKSINFKSSLNAQAFYEEGKQTRFWDWFKPPVKFIQNWILRLGFLDGMPGFIMALMMSFHSFLVRAKLYLLWKQKGGWK
jgi:glycosyltransferase involved in cell wall biosynthesis